MRYVDGVRLLEQEAGVDIGLSQQEEGESVSLTVTQERILLFLRQTDLFIEPR